MGRKGPSVEEPKRFACTQFQHEVGNLVAVDIALPHGRLLGFCNVHRQIVSTVHEDPLDCVDTDSGVDLAASSPGHEQQVSPAQKQV